MRRAILIALAAGLGCNAIIGLELGDPAQGGAGGTGLVATGGSGGSSTTSGSSSTTGGGGGSGGMGTGGAGGAPLPKSCSGLATGPQVIDPDGDQPEPELTVYCEQGWALVHNSVKYEGAGGGSTTTDFWSIPYAARLDLIGDPVLGTTANYYAGILYRYGKTYRDELEDTLGINADVAVASVAGFDETFMKFVAPRFVSGTSNVFQVHFGAGWSAPDFDGDTDLAVNCAVAYFNVTQHYGGCWQYSLGAGVDVDGGWGPHIIATILQGLSPVLTPDPPADAISRLNRISRWAQW